MNKQKKKTLMALVLSGSLLVTACGNTNLTTTTEPGSVTTGDPTTPDEVANDIATTVAEIQNEVSDLTTEIQNSQAAAELEQSWNALQAEILAAVAAISDDGTIDGTAVQDELEAFQETLDELGDEVEPTLIDAWNTLRDRIESLMS